MTDFEDIEISPETEREYQRADSVLFALTQAKEHGLEGEFMTYFLRDLKVTDEQVEKAIWYAQCEWDL